MSLRFAALFVSALGVAACSEPLCETGEESSCVLPSPCPALAFDDCGGFAEIRILSADDSLPRGDDSLASPGDFLIQNDRFTLVVDGLGNPHYLAPSGGSMLDAIAGGTAGDALVQIAQTVGLGPGDGVAYDRYRILDIDRGAALQVRGTLVEDERYKVLTRYEVRNCEPGIRVRTEVYNRGDADAEWALADAWIHGGRGHVPLAPHPGAFADGRRTLEPSAVEVPLLATIPPSPGGSVYGCVPCDTPNLSGFVRSDVSMIGKAERSVSPGDREVFERFVIVTAGDDAAAVTDVAYELRLMLFDEPFATLSGRVSVGTFDGRDTRSAVVVERPASGPGGASTPLTQVLPDASGELEARIPLTGEADAVALAFGREVARESLAVDAAEIDFGTLDGGRTGSLRVSATLDGAPTAALVVMIPADPATAAATRARRFGAGATCAPLLGPSSAGTPACNRFIVDPDARIDAPPGDYRVFATHGPSATLAAADVSVTAGATSEVMLALASLDILPPGALSVDLHAHGPVSFDATAPVDSLVSAFRALDLDLVAMTDHDVLADYTGASGEVTIITGLETTGQRPFPLHEDGPVATIGRFGFLPLTPAPSGPWRGAPADEGVEPGVLFTRVSSAGFDFDAGLVQMLRPWGQPVLDRDVGFPRAIGLDLREELAPEAGIAPALMRRLPDAALFENDAFHTIEVVSGVEPESFVAQRALWHYFLAENLVRAATGGSGAHGIGEAVPGSPRTVVTPPSSETADVLAAIRGGRGIATNGPIIELTMMDEAGVERRPSTTAFEAPSSPRIRVRVLAAPWVPVDEVRVIVNAQILTTLDAELSQPTDPFGTSGIVRYEGEIDVTPGLALEFGDAFIVVEAGAALPPAADLDCDGAPDTGDNDGDGDIDADDVGLIADRATPAPMVTTTSDVCLETAGPLRRAVVPDAPTDPRHVFAEVMGMSPVATTNPLLLDVDGGGYSGAPRGL